jgi:hypothetical protein
MNINDYAEIKFSNFMEEHYDGKDWKLSQTVRQERTEDSKSWEVKEVTVSFIDSSRYKAYTNCWEYVTKILEDCNGSLFNDDTIPLLEI